MHGTTTLQIGTYSKEEGEGNQIKQNLFETQNIHSIWCHLRAAAAAAAAAADDDHNHKKSFAMNFYPHTPFFASSRFFFGIFFFGLCRIFIN